MSRTRDLVLIVRGPDGPELRLPLAEGALTIGRTRANGLVVTGRDVSRRHCVLLRAGDDVTVENLARAGTLRNGERVDGRATLAPGDALRVGEVELVLGEGSGASTPPEVPASSAIIAFGSSVAVPVVLGAGDEDAVTPHDDDENGTGDREAAALASPSTPEVERARELSPVRVAAANGPTPSGTPARVVIPTPDPDADAPPLAAPAAEDEETDDGGRREAEDDGDRGEEGHDDGDAHAHRRRPRAVRGRADPVALLLLALAFFFAGVVTSIAASLVLERLRLQSSSAR